MSATPVLIVLALGLVCVIGLALRLVHFFRSLDSSPRTEASLLEDQ